MNLIQKIVGFFSPPKKIGVVKCITEQWTIPSRYLDRLVQVRVWMPPRYAKDKNIRYPVIFFNDGQDMNAVGVPEVLENGYADKSLEPLILVAVSASDKRMREYGTASQPDYKGRGDLAKQYNLFVIRELVPLVKNRYRCKPELEATIFAGFSLGGLSAFDLVWNNPKLFGKVGAFSGSFWWRSAELNDEDPDAHRIMHAVVQASAPRPNMKFWFQNGTHDETDDRNNNGVIDAIDDTMALIDILTEKGYKPHEDIRYTEVEGGEHNTQTWKKVLPDFLKWAVNP
jgi:enterochelin esterase-like enzyme